jgi:hypothetical protein
VAWALTSGGKTFGGSRTRQILQILVFSPTLPPGSHRSIATSDCLGNLLVAPFGMLVCGQDNLSPLYLSLGRFSTVDQLAHFDYFVVKELDRVFRFGSSHFISPKPSLLDFHRDENPEGI